MLKNDVVSYWIKESRDFGIAIKHRTLRIALDRREVSLEKLTEITRLLWEKQGQDVDELVTLFYLPGVQTDSTVYAIGSCMKDGEASIHYEK
ncbi:hypothetical protein [Mesotoga prima]|uniref:hypothetical protein n=1 Tax=Mesotoga prima TaxID=1184387 RepID=UPI002FDA85C5